MKRASRSSVETEIQSPLDNDRTAFSRRAFLGSAAKGLGALASATALAEEPPNPGRPPASPRANAPRASSFLEILRVPDRVTAYRSFQKTLPVGEISLERQGAQWHGAQVSVETRPQQEALLLTLAAPSTPISAVHLRWQSRVMPGLLILGDAWERSYGDLGWRNVIAERVLPWFFATHDREACHGYGVKTDTRALCFWQLDLDGISLWLNVTNGGNGVELGDRRLEMATIVTRRGQPGEESMTSLRTFNRSLGARATRPITPIYGANDWCYSYGRSTAESILRDTDFIAELSPAAGVRPFSVIDGGWSAGTPAWPDMRSLASGIKQRTARPGIWIRPLEAPAGTARELLLPDARFGANTARARELAYDPTVPGARDRIRDKVQQVVGWGYELVKHDFSTYDLLGQWGFEMGPQPTLPGWSLHDRSRTNAEVIAELYATLRDAAGPTPLLDGCNTIGHLGQGVFDLQRTGDDTSGRQWERTRRMGINTLAFRLPQHGTLFILDPDLVGITDAIPWDLNRQWLDVLARSGTATMVSPGPPARGQEQRAALREAFAIASAGGARAQPDDWMETGTPNLWRVPGRVGSNGLRHYSWSGTDGVSAFLSP